ncbi:MAG: Thioredoxin [Candidatus Falkowbacteria bacterium GW2011_GWA2_39_24]|uniref:Thioredoxin n=1 Tax=Candidatus Falkowbacteria bacterium GW2011_GWA2_39_24 TaxID=1618634 RepID=A0A0G0QYB7_9BACT|nr:MAG: Thioredoxin [Candidatus Falkowbacteria bacterium GW2011_GWA2_39_24]
MLKQLTDDNFATEVLAMSKDKPVLVDFFATWCGPCKMQMPIVEAVAEEIGEGAVVGAMNVEVGQATAQEYGVMSIPTLIVFKAGQPSKTFVGVQTKQTLLQELKG